MEKFFIEEKDFIFRLMYYKIGDMYDKNLDEIIIIECFSKDVLIFVNLILYKKTISESLTKVEEYFSKIEEYEKCSKILEYKKYYEFGF
jgi:hypothetical protein